MSRREWPIIAISRGAIAGLCAVVVGATLGLFASRPVLALAVLALGSIVWGIAARALELPRSALPVIAVAVVLAVAFEFKRVYVLDYARGVPRSLESFIDSVFLSDFVLAAAVAGAGWMGWHSAAMWRSLNRSRRTTRCS